MAPSTLVGAIVFVASVGPGYVYVKIAERRRTTVEPTQLRELAEIVVTGALATLVGVVLALIAGEQFGFLDATAVSHHLGEYIVAQPGDAGIAIAIVLITSYSIAALVAAVVSRASPRIYPDSAWYAMFERALPKDHVNVATVELTDGRKVTGTIVAFTAEQTPVDDRELTLGRTNTDRIKVQARSGSDPADLYEDYIILRGSDIANISLTHWPVSPV